jgi:hypothetical protein
MCEKKINIKEIPYGISDFEAIREEDYYYVDKTGYLREIEKAGKYLFFIRPRRFGKSLFLSLMDTYYNISKEDQFDRFFKGTSIYQNPTKERNSYLILKFNFSTVSPDIDTVEESFFGHVLEAVDLFISEYKQYLNIDDKETLEELKQKKIAPDILRHLIHLSRKSNQKLFIIIDEYDNFANTILTISGARKYKELTHGEGFFKAFFNVLKGGTSGSGAPISRLFITGVSPITMDDVTSGFNIGKNITIDLKFNKMLGFTMDEVTKIIEYYHTQGRIKHPDRFLLEIMERWYNHYTFSTKTQDLVFNTGLVLYFLDEYFKEYEIPGELVDENVRIDYGKLRHLVVIDRGDQRSPNGNFSQLERIMEKGEITAKLARSFSVEKMTHTNNFISLLFYFGLLTMAGEERGKTKFKIPNETVKRLYFEYIKEGYEETGIFSLDFFKYSELMTDMAYDGNWKPLFNYLTGEMKARMSLRDLMTGEKSIQAFLVVYLGLGDLYIVHSEKELNKGYADIVLEPFFVGYRDIQYSYILEIKYIKPMDFTPKKLEQIKSEAAEQLETYSLDRNFKKNMEKTTLIKLALIFSGHELVYIGAAA